jgi:hypothetical protein
MSDAEWDEAYHEAWKAYFTWEHMETVARRHARLPANRPKKALQYLNEFKMIYEIEGLHALEGGILRRKHRRSRRPGFRREPALTFYPRFVIETAVKWFRYVREYRREKALIERILADPARWDYEDVAVRPVAPDELETLELFTETTGGTAAVAKKLRQDELLASARAVA